MMDGDTKPAPKATKRRGRPKKKDVLANTPGKRLTRGRPPGEAAAMAAFKARLLTSPKSEKVIETIIDAALDQGHPHQASAWKLVLDRIMPVSSFEKSAGGKSKVTINITGVGENVSVSGEEDEVIDGDYEEVDDD